VEQGNRKIEKLDLIKLTTYLYIIFFIYAGINHFRHPNFYDSIVPTFIPFPRYTHLLVGILEVIIPILLLTKYRSTAAIFMIVFIIILYLGNLHVWINKLPYGNNYFTNSQHTFRLFLQIVLIYITYIIYKHG